MTQDVVCTLNQILHGAMSPAARLHRFRHQGVAVGMAPLTIVPSDFSFSQFQELPGPSIERDKGKRMLLSGI